MSSVQKALVHGVAATIMNYGYKSLGSLVLDTYIRKQYGGHFQFLTIQGLVLAWLTMVTSLVYDAFPSLKSLRTVKRYLLIIAMPLSVVISTIYWTLVTLFPKLIMQMGPQENTEPTSSGAVEAMFRIPLKMDLALHAAPAISLALDFFLFEEKFGQRDIRIAVPLASLSFATGYGVWVEHCAKHNNGVFPYPFLTENTLPVRIGIYAGATILAIGSFRLFNKLHR